LWAACAFQDALKAAGWAMRHLLAPRPNTGLSTDIDIDDEGLRGTTAALLTHPTLQDPRPKNARAKAAADPSHIVNPSLGAID